MTLFDFINYLRTARKYPKEVEFEGLTFKLEGDNHDRYVWMNYKFTEADGCYERLSDYMATPYYLGKELKIKERKG